MRPPPYGGGRHYCLNCLPTYGKNKIERKTIVRQVFKKKAIELRGGKCEICGYNKCIAAFHFHHLDPKVKEFALSTDITNWDKYYPEMQKCILVCSNCHAEPHHCGQIPNVGSGISLQN